MVEHPHKGKPWLFFQKIHKMNILVAFLIALFCQHVKLQQLSLYAFAQLLFTTNPTNYIIMFCTINFDLEHWKL